MDLKFQWQKDNKDIDGKESRFNHTRTGDTSILHISHVRKSDKGYYQCLVKNSVEKSGKSSQRADLSVCKFVILFEGKWLPDNVTMFLCPLS